MPALLKKLLRESPEVSHQAVEGVVFRIHGPDNFVHGPSQLPRRAVDLVDVGRGRGEGIQFRAYRLAQTW
jgi:hypothetical protein